MTDGHVSKVDFNRPVYEVVGELNARIAKAEERAGISPTWYIVPTETLAVFFDKAQARLDRISEVKSLKGIKTHTEDHSVFDSKTWTGRRTRSDQRAIFRSNVPKAIGDVDALISLVEQHRLNDPNYLDTLKRLRYNLTEILDLQDSEVDWNPNLKALGENAKKAIAESDKVANYVKGSPTLMLVTFLTLCLILGWNPLIALAGFFGAKADDGKAG